MGRSKFFSEDHLVLAIDGVPLETLVAKALPGEPHMDGLVPTLLEELHDSRERELVWTRALPGPGALARFPVLMCPDDCDLSCNLIIAEVESTDATVTWHRLGVGVTASSTFPNTIAGESVDWIAGLGPMTFGRAAYERCLGAFRAELREG